MFLDDENASERLRSRDTLSSIWLAGAIFVACVVVVLGMLSTAHADAAQGGGSREHDRVTLLDAPARLP